MTDTKQDEITLETFTVDVNLELQFATIKSSKRKAEFRVGKSRYAIFFSVFSEKSQVPKELSGKYSTLKSGIDAVTRYLKNAPETFAVKSDRLHQERQLRKHAKSDASNG